MSVICVYGGECTGCTMCQKEKEEIDRCLICGSALFSGDTVLETDDGRLCNDGECIGEYVKNNADKSDIADYVNDFADDFVSEHKWELIEYAAENETLWKKLTDKFIENDKQSFNDWWIEKKNLSLCWCE